MILIKNKPYSFLKQTIKLLSSSYHYCKKMLALAKFNNEDMNSPNNLLYSSIVNRIDFTIFELLDEDDRKIMHTEMILGITGSERTKGYSRSTYYEYSRKAYGNMLSYLVK